MPTRKLFWMLTTVLIIAGWAAKATADVELARSVYKGTVSSWNVEMVRTLTQLDDNRYRLRSEAKNMFASIKENSEFSATDGRIVPLNYAYDRKVFGRHTSEKIAFDWGANNAFYSRSDRSNRTEHPLTEGLLDPALYQLALQADLAGDKKNLSYKFLKRRRVETYDFQVIGEEQFKLQNKTYGALVVVREDKAKGKSTRVWILPQLDYQVAKIQHTDDGDTYEVHLVSYKSDGGKLQQLYRSLRAP